MTSATENLATIKSAHDGLKSWAGAAGTRIAEELDAFVDPVTTKALGGFFGGVTEWRARKEQHRVAYDEAKTRAVAHQDTLAQVAVVEARLKEINEQTDAKMEQLRLLGKPQDEFVGLRTDWVSEFSKRAELLEQQCVTLSATPNTRLKATVLRASDVTPIAEGLKQALRGTKIRAEKIDLIFSAVSTSTSPLDSWQAILDELLELAWLKVEDESSVTLPATPRLDAAGLVQKVKVAIAKQFEHSGWIELALQDLKDIPVFEYKVREGDFIPFQDASPGQQATALLSILLLQDGPPLMIDQPEDDLNMKIINEIVRSIWAAKSHRQVVFASHNANLVVNGDAELIVCCDYRTSATESGGRIKLAGAIDMPEIRQEITDVMEGGKEAFTLRYQKYGF